MQNKNTQNQLSKLVDRGNQLYAAGKFQEAEIAYRKALVIAKIPAILYNIGLCQYSKMEYERAGSTLWELVTTPGHDGKLGMNELSLCELHLGNVSKGMRLYGYRATTGNVKFPALPIPFIDDAMIEFSGRHVLILNEQGLGDELMFSRSIHALCSVAKSVTWQVYPENARLFRENFKFTNLVFFTERSFSIEFVSKFDCYSSSGTVFSNCMAKKVLPPTKLEAKRSIPRSDKHKIGFIFETNRKSPNSHQRSIDRDFFKRFLDHPHYDVELYNLQPDRSVDFAISTISHKFDTRDSAGVFASMDEIYTIDTFGAHLALALGVKTALVYREYLDWRWKIGLYPEVALLKTGNNQ